MRQAVPLDAAADLRGLGDADADGDLDNNAPRRPQEHSRSTSTSSSPAPPDNEESDFFFGANDSQSSLGVPNLQDMLVVDDACMPPVHRLPNEILIAIFAKLSTSSDILHVMLTCKRWARNAVDILWHRPSCSSWPKHESICQTLSLENPYFSYRDFVRRLNLSALADKVNDGSVMPLAECTRVERMTLTGCAKLTDTGLIALVSGNTHLYSLDVSLPPPQSTDTMRDHITEASIDAIAEHCPRLQGLNISGCQRISNESLVRLAQHCRYLKRLKLNDCGQLKDEAVFAFAEYCPNILEIDLQQCRLIGNEPVTALFARGQALRELRLAGCDRVDDLAFLSLPQYRTYEHLRILDLTSCIGITDRSVDKIIDVAPRLRNLVLQKCRNLTDAAVYSISRLGRNLHFLHLGHCSNITDDGVKRLISLCNRIRYIDLGCCTNLTDDSVTKLAGLPKLKRIGLVKCSNITDASVIALANANRRPRMRRDQHGCLIPVEYSTSQSCLERVHLSYCTNLTQTSIIRLLNSCPRLTHLSLTGVQAFLRDDLDTYSRPAPDEFTEHQRSVFCVFSGQGVANLRRHFNQMLATDESRRNLRPTPMGVVGTNFPNGGGLPAAAAVPHLQILDTGFDDGDPDTVDDDDDVPEHGSEMVIDTQPLLGNHNPPPPQHVAGTVSPTNPFSYVAGHPPYIPQSIPFHGVPVSFTAIAPLHYAQQPSYAAVVNGTAAQENAAAVSANADVQVTAPAPTTNGGTTTAETLSELTAIEALIDISSQPDVNAQYGAAQGSGGPQPQPHPSGGAGAA